MAASKRFRQRILIDNKNFSISPRTFIETLLTPTINVSQITENHLNISNNKEPIQTNQLVDIQQQRDDEFGEKSKLFQNNFEIISKTITNNKQTNDNITKIIVDEIQNNNEDDWVCPVAVALRKAGYNVPLRPSKSWLERG
ncbi:unnamed protein product [Rotaria sp. Silwood1]|nr:unnamed protein product [Rotaria sp. Silwood1]CAF3684218.1 unnamed protein product [Rotaria sp. Silwood1]CAF4508902.1 unnamed protein product [Rotaria sp. Silwood1]CAF4696496.1 unnamed protein product [Rotaria sp. Silwood1]